MIKGKIVVEQEVDYTEMVLTLRGLFYSLEGFLDCEPSTKESIDFSSMRQLAAHGISLVDEMIIGSTPCKRR